MNDPQKTELDLLLGVSAAIIIFILLVAAAKFSNEFSRKLRYLNSEIRRTDGAEREYWIRRRRRLWLSLIPFVKY